MKNGRIEPLLPKCGKMGRPRKDRREPADAMVWIFKTGAPWRGLSEYYEPWETGYNNFLRWSDAGVWKNVLQNLNPEQEVRWQIMVDSSSVKAHQNSAGAKKGPIIIRLLVDPEEG